MRSAAAEASGAAPVDTRTLRDVLSHFLTGVAVAATESGGQRFGMTVNSFTSVSLDPPLVLFCAARTSGTLREIQRSGAFALSFLAGGQHEVARRFATASGNRFGALEVVTPLGGTGSPVLAASLAFLDCRLADVIPRGDHSIVLGSVVAAGTLSRSDAPLAFFRSTLTTLS
jgi:3-hydroxy-9,10-secoandrosta-1,3,5(10)-triene-9,17-dione monooxygenase reductase component